MLALKSSSPPRGSWELHIVSCKVLEVINLILEMNSGVPWATGGPHIGGVFSAEFVTLTDLDICLAFPECAGP